MFLAAFLSIIREVIPRVSFQNFDVFIFPTYFRRLFQLMYGFLAAPPKKTFSGAAISACEKGHHWIAAVEVFETMLKVSLQPHVVSYNAVPRLPGAWRKNTAAKGFPWRLDSGANKPEDKLWKAGTWLKEFKT